MNPLMLGVILFTVTLSALAQLALKLGARSLVCVPHAAGCAPLLAGISSPFIWAGLAAYGLSVLSWVWVLSRTELSVAYPFVGISFVMTMAFGALVLNENVTTLRLLGTLFIVFGCVLVARSA